MTSRKKKVEIVYEICDVCKTAEKKTWPEHYTG